MPPRPERPSDAKYYERDRVELFSQVDVFRDVPLAYPLPAEELAIDAAEGGGGRRFLSGPLEFGAAMLITPNCSLGAQGTAGYGHPVRTLVAGDSARSTSRSSSSRFPRALRSCTCPSPFTTHSWRASACRSWRIEARSSCNGSSCGSTQGGSRTISTRSIRRWIESSLCRRIPGVDRRRLS